MKIVDYYKKAVRLAEKANSAINRANADYEHWRNIAEEEYKSDLLGEQGYKEQLEKLETERDSVVRGALSHILETVDEFDVEMDELGRLDGNKIDDGTMKLLNSGITLTSKDWQALANMHKDNYVMSRILQERYNANRPQEKNLVIVQFGQFPEDRKMVFSKFARTLYNACKSDALPSLSGSGKLKTVTDYYNYLAQASLEDMQLFEEESFDSLDTDFPVETVNGKAECAAKRTTSYSPADFNFNFTPVRETGNNAGKIF